MVIEEIIIIGPITGQIIEIDQEADKIHNGHLETEVKVEVEMKTMVMIVLEVEVEIEIKGDEKNPGLDQIHG